jgi:flagellar motor switch protein FliM
LLFDPAAVGFLLTGILGGDPDDAEPATSLTTPQRAVLGTMADQLIQKLGASFQAAGLSFRRLPPSASVPSDAQLVTVSILLGDGAPRRVRLAIAREALHAAAGQCATTPSASDAARIPSILGQAELDLVCELGRVRKTVGEVQGLKIGDTLRLDTLVSDSVALHVQGHVIVRGQPTTQGSRIALSVTDAARALRSDAA